MKRKNHLTVIGVDKSGEPILAHLDEGDEDDNSAAETEAFEEAEDDNLAKESD